MLIYFGMEKILVSACLIGDKVRYDGRGNYNPNIKYILENFDVIPFCPEVEGGLPIPRIPSEIKNGEVINKEGKNVTRNFVEGANKALNIVSYFNITTAILKENSPSCGVHNIHDGNFNNKLIEGEGITTKLLRQHGVKIISENEIEQFLIDKKIIEK